jgi:hypothetical protein
MKKNKKFCNKILPSLGILLVFFILILGGYWFCFKKENKNLISEVKDILINDSCKFARVLDGKCLENKEEKNIWPVAVMFDNHPDSWHQYGLNSAQIVYSTLVEGGATRMMAIFSSTDEIEKIGPVRSARPYFLTWAKEYDAVFTHVGGSPEALQKIKDWKILDCNEMTSYGPEYFWRAWSKPSPHNVYTSNENIFNVRKDWGVASSTSEFDNWKFADEENFTAPLGASENAEEISIKYSEIYPYDIKYEYSTTTQEYLRFQNKKPQKDALDNSQIAVKNLILQYVPKEKMLDSIGRLEINTLGYGKAEFFIAGKKYSGTWEKKDLTSRTMFYDEQGNEMKFLRGNVWIEVIPGEKEVISE